MIYTGLWSFYFFHTIPCDTMRYDASLVYVSALMNKRHEMTAIWTYFTIKKSNADCKLCFVKQRLIKSHIKRERQELVHAGCGSLVVNVL